MRALITGANRGIGAATAIALARAGFDLHLHYRRHEEEAKAVAAECNALGVRTALHSAELGEPAAVDRLVREVESTPGPLAAIVHNAGEYPRTPLADADPDTFRALLETHAVAPLEITRRLRPRLAASRPGRVVFVSSVLAFQGSAHGAPYAAAKAAQIGLVRSLARELAPDILVNAVAPGSIDTAILAGDPPERRAERERSIPLHRLGRPEEVAATIAYLVSPAASYVTGTTAHVNGGIASP